MRFLSSTSRLSKESHLSRRNSNLFHFRVVLYTFPSKCHEMHSKSGSGICIYIGSGLLNHLPLVLLPGSDGSSLFKNCTVSHVNSASELLQQVISVRLLALAEKEHQQNEQTPPKDDQVEPLNKVNRKVLPFSSWPLEYLNFPGLKMVRLSLQSEPQGPVLQQVAAQVPKYRKHFQIAQCYIFADPNYDLTMGSTYKPTEASSS